MDTLDKKLNEVYLGRVVRKDLLHRIKKGTNVPSFVLEFLLAKYCATCTIRTCAIDKGVPNCAACSEFESCTKIKDFIAGESNETHRVALAGHIRD